MSNNLEILIGKKTIQKTLINELYKKNLIDFVDTSNITKKLDEDIKKLKESQDNDVKNIIIEIPI